MALTQVSTKGLKDGTILNADVNASAAIAGTKISSDFGSQNITTTGRLLLGTTTEGHTDADDLTIATSSGYAGITLRSPSDQGGAIYFSDATSGAGEYDGQILYSQSSRTMQLITANNPRLTLDSSGNLLSGTTSSSLLSNFNTNAGGLVLDDIGSGATAFLATHGDKQIFLGNDTSANYLWGYSNHNLLFGTNNQTRLTITSTGTVGIGTSSPSNLLHCTRTSTPAYSSSSNTNDSTVLLQNLGAAGHSTLEFQCKSSGTTQTGKATISATPEAASSRATSLTFGTRNASSAMEERMRINYVGRVAIGTTVPSELFTINGADQSALIRTSNAVGTAKLKFEADGANYAGIGLENTSLVFRCSNSSTPTTRFTIFADGSITSSGDIRVDRGTTAIDGILGQAYSGYFGLKHADQTINQEYMIISADSHTFISASNGAGIYIRPDANSEAHQTFFNTNDTTFKTNVFMDSHYITRNSWEYGFLVGAQNNLGASDQYTNPIFSIGTSHLPTSTALSDMYGIGYSHGNASFNPSGAGWGMYVAADGEARVYLDGSYGNIYFGGNLASVTRHISSVTGDYGSMQINNGGKNGWSGYSIDGHSVFMSNGSASGDYIGLYDYNANSWVILSQRLSYTRLHHAGLSRLETTSAGVYITGTLTASSTKSFRISHPLSELSETKDLVHAAIEGPQMDLMYRGKVDLVNGTATVNIDTKSGMTEGTFDVLNRDVQCFTTNETGWTNVKGSVTGNKLTIVAEDNSCTDTISWMVIGERKDNGVVSSEVTDDNGDLIVEPDKQVFEAEPKMDD